MYKLLALLLLCACFSASGFTQQQPVPVEGRLVSESDTPISGATIRAKSAQKTVMSDTEGRFLINTLGESDTLVITHINYDGLSISVANILRRSAPIVLQPKNSQMEEVTVVNTGYQKLPKERSTGSFELISQKQLNQQISTDILSRLEATSTILFDKESSRPTVTIRGLSTINSDKSPLIILDNFPYEGDLMNINPNDIESVTVLKDAAAASIWGAKAGNGVIVITTKSGSSAQRIKFEFTSNLTRTGKPKLHTLPLINTADFLEVEEFLFSRGYRFSDTSSLNRPSFTPYYELLFRQRRGEVDQSFVDAQVNFWRDLDIRDQYNAYSYQPALRQQYALNARGGSEKASFYLGAGYDRNIDNLSATYDRITVRSETTLRPVKNLQITGGLTYTNSTSKTGKMEYGLKMREYPYALFRNEDGSSASVTHFIRQPFIDTVGSGRLQDWNYYPLENYKHEYSTINLNELRATLAANYRIARDFSVQVNYQYQDQNRETNLIRSPDSYFTRDLVNQFSSIDRVSGVVSYAVPLGSIWTQTMGKISAHNLRAQLQFNKDVGEHNINAIIGTEIRKINTPGVRNRQYGYDTDLRIASSVDYVTQHPNFLTGRLTTIPNEFSSSETFSRFVSQFFNASYTYRKKYTFSASARRDASNLFGLEINEKWQPLWSVGGVWDVTKESFFKKSWMSSLRLRSTFGYSGNINSSQTALTTIQYINPNSVTNFPAARVSEVVNPFLKWEQTNMWNTAIDFSVTGGRFFGSLEYYTKRSKDLIGPSELDPTAGLSRAYLFRNVANMKARGVEANLNAIAIKGPLQWSINLLFSYNRTIVTDYFVFNTLGSSNISSGETISALKGQPVYSVISYKWEGLNSEGNPQGLLNKEVSTNYTQLTGSGTQLEDLVFHGSATPLLWGSLIQRFNWKRLELGVALLYKFNYYFRKESINYNTLFSAYVGHSDYAKRWQQPGDELTTSVPAMVYPAATNRENFYNNSEVLVRRGDQIRLQFINLSYTFNHDRKSRLSLGQMQLFLNAANLGPIWVKNEEKIDPDFYNIRSIPPAPSVSIGLRSTF